MFEWKGNTVWQKVWSLIRSQLSLPRFDLFLQGALLILTLLEGYCYLLLRRSAAAGLLSARVEDWVLMGSAVSELLFGAALAWNGRGKRQYALSSWLLATSVCGLLVLAFDQPAIDIPTVDFCNSASLVRISSENWDSLRTSLIVVTAILCSLARISVWTHGYTYLDDHNMKNGAYYYGILVSIRISVGLNARSWFQVHSRGEGWWKGQLSLSALTLMFAILYALFPKRIKGWKVVENDDDESGFLSTLLRVLGNKVVMVQTLALALITTAVWGFIFHESEYVQARYHFEAAPNWSEGRTTRLAGDVLRALVIIFFVSIFRARFSGCRVEGVKSTTASKVGAVVAILAAAFFAAVAVVKCDTAELVGLNGQYQQPECSQQCGCNSELYGFAPVCTINTLSTYFSPCHAGCTDYEELNGFMILYNCTCGGTERAVRGDCNVISCQTMFSVYQIVHSVALAVSAVCLLMQGMAIVRATRVGDRPMALGVALGATAFISHVPGHLMYNFISDSTCALEDAGTCLFHTKTLPTALGAVSAALALLSAIFSFVAFFLQRREIKALVS